MEHRGRGLCSDANIAGSENATGGILRAVPLLLSEDKAIAHENCQYHCG
jgi:hypothetical protein